MDQFPTFHNLDLIHPYSGDDLLEIRNFNPHTQLEGYSITTMAHTNSGMSTLYAQRLMREIETEDRLAKKSLKVNLVKSHDPSDCVICLGVCGKNNSYKLTCDCKYSCHKKCIESWLKVSQSCPFCKI